MSCSDALVLWPHTIAHTHFPARGWDFCITHLLRLTSDISCSRNFPSLSPQINGALASSFYLLPFYPLLLCPASIALFKDPPHNTYLLTYLVISVCVIIGMALSLQGKAPYFIPFLSLNNLIRWLLRSRCMIYILKNWRSMSSFASVLLSVNSIRPQGRFMRCWRCICLLW